jgi:hypothetical protein
MCCKGKEELEGISVGLDGIVAHAPDMGEVLIEELIDTGGKSHRFHLFQEVKSKRFLRLFASATLRYMAVYV